MRRMTSTAKRAILLSAILLSPLPFRYDSYAQDQSKTTEKEKKITKGTWTLGDYVPRDIQDYSWIIVQDRLSKNESKEVPVVKFDQDFLKSSKLGTIPIQTEVPPILYFISWGGMNYYGIPWPLDAVEGYEKGDNVGWVPGSVLEKGKRKQADPNK